MKWHPWFENAKLYESTYVKIDESLFMDSNENICS